MEEEILNIEVPQEAVEEVMAKAQDTVDAILPDPRIAELETKVESLQAELAAANELITRLRTVKDAYKKIAAQGVQEVFYMQRYAPHNYAERRAIEFPAEFNAVQDVN